jgi:hypothetical protein
MARILCGQFRGVVIIAHVIDVVVCGDTINMMPSNVPSMTVLKVAEIYLRSIVLIVTMFVAMVIYGIYVEPVGEQVLLAAITGGVAVVIFDKPKIGDNDA